MAQLRYKSTRIDSFAVNLPPIEVTSSALEDRLAPVYQRLQIPFGTLEKLSGVKTRYYWEDSILPSVVGTEAARKALEQSNIRPQDIGAVFNCSVTRDYFEPATACLIHRNLGLHESAFVMDISNACIGFSNGIMTMASMIDSGAIKAGIIIAPETTGRAVEYTVQYLLRKDHLTREQILKIVPTLTIGAGAVAFVLAHESLSPRGHKLLGTVALSASEHSDLCAGNADYNMSQGNEAEDVVMTTDSPKLIANAAKVGARAWQEASPFLQWGSEQIDHIFCHQVSKQLNEAWFREIGLEKSKEYTIYPKYGNMVSAALPTAMVLGSEEKQIQPGAKVLMAAFGSGLNAIFTGVEW